MLIPYVVSFIILVSTAIIRGELSRALREAAIKAGVQVEFGKAVESVTEHDDGVVVQFADGIHSRTRYGIMPTIVMDGGATPWLSAGAEALANVLPKAQRRTLEGQTHDVKVEAIAPAIVEFLKG